MPADPATVAIVEDDPSTSKALGRLIESLGYRVRAFSSANDFVDASAHDGPDCILLDVGLPDINGLKLQELLLEKGHRTPIVFLTGTGDVPMSVRAMRGGAIDFLLKPVDESDLAQALVRAIDASRALERADLDLAEAAGKLAALTAREKEVLSCVLTGAMNKQIAAYLGIAEKTVKIHRGRVMEKLQAKTVVDLIAIADASGFAADETLKR